MGINDQKAAELLKKNAEGRCTPEEENLLRSWYNRQAEQAEALPDGLDWLAMKSAIWQELQDRNTPARQKQPLWYRYAAAAIVFIALGLGTYYYFLNHTGTNNQITNNDIPPGGNKATLTLADGRRIVLDEAANGELAEESGIKITKTEDGQLVYDVAGARITDARQPVGASDGQGEEREISYNTIQTPRGGQYKVILPDSSVVWLNAASSLRYPTRFAGAERRVELTGEAFFQIRHQTQDTRHKTASAQAGGDANKSKIVNHKSKIPFIVATATQEVQVLGTEFNINAYTDEAAVKTTLLEGSVAVRVASTSVQSTNQPINQSTTLRPGQQSILSANSLAVVAVDAEQAIAWKNGLIVLDHADLPTIIRQIARWYDVDFDMADIPTGMSLNGELPRNSNLSGILEALELNTNLKFTLTERRVMVRK